MEWSDQGLVLGVSKYGENDAILDVLTLDNGRCRGFVRGAMGKRLRGVLQAGNGVLLSWRARLSTNLGHFTIESEKARAAHIYGDPLRLAALNNISSLLIKLLPERERVENIYDAHTALLDLLCEPQASGEQCAMAVIKFEAGLLNELGFGMDLRCCAVSGEVENLTHVSPKSGRAVSRGAAQPYLDKLLPLPPFLLSGNQANPQDIIDGFNLTAYFLARHLLHPLNSDLPDERHRLVDCFTEHAKNA